MKSGNRVFEIAKLDVAEVTVDVSFIGNIGDVFFNATEIAKPFGKLPKDFLRLTSTQEYITEILAESGKENPPFQELVLTISSPAFRRKLYKWTESRLQSTDAPISL